MAPFNSSRASIRVRQGWTAKNLLLHVDRLNVDAEPATDPSAVTDAQRDNAYSQWVDGMMNLNLEY